MIKYISLDIETTGLDPSVNQVLEVAAVYDNGIHFDDLPRFECLLVHTAYTFNLAAAVMNADLIELLNTLSPSLDGRPRRNLMGNKWICVPSDFERLFTSWLKGLDIEKPVLAGKNLAFDLSFLKPLGFPEHHHRVLDPAMYYIKPSDTVPPNLATCAERAGLDASGLHRAMFDAELVVKLLRASYEG